MGGASAPTLLGPVAEIRAERVGAEAPPIKTPGRSRFGWPGRRPLTPATVPRCRPAG
ncbi:DUF6053 domain-containing protein [Lysobacter enzymogenes]|uniref:DUF6053 domain-containing protein n=1 Tax=Lysobacter enzymogenes TaxID=69 RepID=UPI003D18B207